LVKSSKAPRSNKSVLEHSLYKPFKASFRYSRWEESTWPAPVRPLVVGGIDQRTDVGRPTEIDSRIRGLKTDKFLTRDITMTNEFEYLLTVPDIISKHVDKWMAVVGKEVMVGDSPKEVLEKAAKLFPGKEPFVAKFPKETAMLL